jgi:hypothetical protein
MRKKTIDDMAKKPLEIPDPEKPMVLPPNEPIEPARPIREPEIKPEIEPTVPFNPPKEIPPNEQIHLKLKWL